MFYIDHFGLGYFINLPINSIKTYYETDYETYYSVSIQDINFNLNFNCFRKEEMDR